MQLLTEANFDTFIRAKPTAVVLFDADWDIDYRPMMRRKMENAEHLLNERANFGEVNCDKSPELAIANTILNVPTIAYYCDGKLVGSSIGALQDIFLRLESIIANSPDLSS